MIEVIKHGKYTKKYTHTCSKCGCVVTFMQEDIDKATDTLTETKYVDVVEDEGKTKYRQAETVKTEVYKAICPECLNVDNIPLTELEEYTGE